VNSERTRTNKSGLYLDSYRAQVVSISHPKKRHMAKVRIIGLWADIPDSDLPWAEYLMPLGARKEEGDAMPCQVGDVVWVDFPQSGDSRFPRIVGSAYHLSDDGQDNQIPNDLFENAYNHKRTSKQPDAPNAKYGDKVLDLFGLLQQLTQDGQWCLTHKSSGTALHITQNGELVINAQGNSFRSSSGNTTEEVGGELKIFVEGKTTLNSPTGVDVIGDLMVDGNITSTKNVIDKTSSMQTMRDKYNSHVNAHDSPASVHKASHKMT